MHALIIYCTVYNTYIVYCIMLSTRSWSMQSFKSRNKYADTQFIGLKPSFYAFFLGVIRKYIYFFKVLKEFFSDY